MDRTDRSRSLERLAKALRPPPVEELASALQDCLDEAVERGAKRAEEQIEEKWGPRFDRMDTRLDRQDDTLRLMWKQMKGNGNLPIDD